MHPLRPYKDTDLRDLTVALLAGARERLEDSALADPAFLERCKRYWGQQRIVPPIARVVAAEPEAPADLQEWAREALRSNAVRSLQQLSVIVALTRSLALDAGIESMPLKGATLSLLLYGDPGYRACGDIDLLVPEARFGDAIEFLTRQRGYTHARADGSRHPAGSVIRPHPAHHEIALASPCGTHVVEVHRRLNRQRGLLPAGFEQLRDAAARVETGGSTLRVPGPEHLLAYLAVHAMLSRWSAMKWLYDLPHVIDRFGDATLEAARRQAHTAGFIPLLEGALALGARLAGREYPAGDRTARHRGQFVVNAVWERLGDGAYAVEDRRDLLRLAVFRMTLLSGLAPRLALLRSRLTPVTR
jgi:hypothetical protein